MKRIELTKEQIEYLFKRGFQQDDTQHSGFYFFEKTDPSYEIWILIPGYENERFSKYEFNFEVLTYDDPAEGEQMYKEHIEFGQSLEEFIEAFID